MINKYPTELELKAAIRQVAEGMYDLDKSWELRDEFDFKCPFCGDIPPITDTHDINTEGEDHTFFCWETGYALGFSAMGHIGVKRYEETALVFADGEKKLWKNYEIDEIENITITEGTAELVTGLEQKGIQFGMWEIKSNVDNYPPTITATNDKGDNVKFVCTGEWKEVGEEDE